jgi:predicted ATPase
VLIRFEVANFRSMLEPVELSMVAVDRDRSEAREVPNLGESLLPVAAIYGPNASGKSNVVAALAWLVDAVRDSLRGWDDEIPIEPFAFTGGEDRPSQFTVEYVVDGVRFEYVLELDRRAVRYEALFHYPEKKRRRIFERDGDELKLQRGLGVLAGTRELMTPRTLALSIARRFEEPHVSGFANRLLAVGTLDSSVFLRRVFRYGHRRLDWAFQKPDDEELAFLRIFEQGTPFGSDRVQALALLRLADLGIDDVLVDEHEFHLPGRTTGSMPAFKERRVRLVHQTADGGAPIDFAAESEGTRTWFNLIGPVLSALREGSLLLFDELDASLHPTLAAELIRLFHDPATNPRGAQLVFTSHDTSLLNHLNRDEVWLTEKDGRGVTHLGALAEFAGERVRRSQNLEKAYLHGRFGALPDVDRAEMLRALGLIG